MTQINWQFQVNNRAGGYIVTATDWNDYGSCFRSFIDQTTGSGTTDNVPLPIGIDLVNDRVYISDPDSATPENANHADTTLSVVGSSTFNGTMDLTSAVISGASALVFEGATANAHETTFAITDPTADRTITFKDGTGTVAFTSDITTVAGSDHQVQFNDNGSFGADANFTYDGSATTLKATLTVGQDDTGHDVKFFGATSGSYVQWDESADKLIINGNGGNGLELTNGIASFQNNVDIDGDIDVDGTTNLDAVDIDGAVQIDGTVTIGVDDTGYDVKFFGDESGSHMLWDASADDLEFFGNSKINLNGTTAGSTNFQINFAESYNVFADNTGTGSDNSRLWISGNAGGACYIGPRAGGSLFEDIFLRADVTVSGALSKGSGSFDIPHPTKGGDWRLRHSFLEGPTCDNIYRGTVTISGSSATVDLDTVSNMTAGTWEALNTNTWSMVSSSGNAVTWSLSGKTLTINGPNGAVCSWMVIGERKDDNIKGSKQTDSNGKLITEYENADINADADA